MVRSRWMDLIKREEEPRENDGTWAEIASRDPRHPATDQDLSLLPPSPHSPQAPRMTGQSPPFVPRPPISPQAAECFRTATIPVEALEDACKNCAAETGDVEDYPKGFEV